MTTACMTMDMDWASEPAIKFAIDYFEARGIPLTLFTTHPSDQVKLACAQHEVGLHPFFGTGSDHGDSVESVIQAVQKLDHNVSAFRCHRFASSNEALEKLVVAGMKACSNVCTDLEVVTPFRNRCGLLEVPIYMEDGSYLRNGHSLDDAGCLTQGALPSVPRVLLIHPMHLRLNSPSFEFMRSIKDRLGKRAWNSLSASDLSSMENKGRGIRDFLGEALSGFSSYVSFSDSCQPLSIRT